MTNWNGIPYVARRIWVLALCGTLLTGCSTGDITLPGINQDPTADAGVDLTTDVGQQVTLNGLGSTDADDDPLTFSWQQRSGPSVTLEGPNTVQPSFVPIEDGFYEFALTVTDGRGGSDISVVRVFVGDVDPATCPRADAGTDQTVNEGAAVRLRGGNSADPGGRPLTFEWFQLSGPRVSINGVFIVEPSFAAPQATGADIELEFELTVTNDQGCPDRDTVVITVRDRDSGDPCNGVVCNDDGQFCNGVETCESGACVSSNAPCGTGETCNESTDSCDSATVCTTDSDCDDDIYCNGQEICVSGACLDGTEPCSAGDTCNEGTDSCDSATACTTNSDCDDDLFCNGDETCVAGECVAGTEPCSATETCDEGTDSCEAVTACTINSDCDDDLFCNGDETCVADECVAGTEPCSAAETCDEQDDTCTPTDPDDAPLGLVVVTSPDPARRGETLDIELTVTNPGTSDRTGVVLTLDYPDGLNGLFNSLFNGFCPGTSCSRQERATFNIGTLAGGEGRTFSMPIQVASNTADGTIIDFNAMVVDVLGSQVLGTNSITVNATRRLELALVENVDPVPMGGELVYTLTYGLRETDNGIPTAFLSMPVPDGTSFVSATDGGVLSGSVIEWSLGAIGPGQSGEVQATVQVNGLGEGSIIEAEATLKDALTPTNRVRYQAATRVQNDIPLELVVVTSLDPVRPGETMDVELTVTNTGEFPRNGVFLTLEYPDGLNGLFNSLFRGFCPGTSCSRQERATFNIGTLAPGVGFTFSMPIQVSSGTPDGGVISFEAEVSASNGDRMETGTSFSVLGSRKFQLTLVENLDPIPTDGELVYTITYGLLKIGNGVPDGVLSMPVPDGTSFVSATAGGMLNGNVNVIEWSLGEIGPGQSGEVQATVQVNGLVEGSIIDAEATLEDIETPANHVRSQAATRVQSVVPLELAVVTSLDRVLPGGSLNVEFTVTNTGGFERNGVVLTLEYPDGLNGLFNSLFDGSCPGTSCSRQERATFNIGTLASGGQIFFSMPLIVATGTLEGRLIRFDALVFDNAGSQVIDTAVLKVGN